MRDDFFIRVLVRLLPRNDHTREIEAHYRGSLRLARQRHGPATVHLLALIDALRAARALRRPAVHEEMPAMPSIVQDLRVAVRAHRRSPLFSAGFIAVLALGIGANGAVFSLVQSVLLEPLPYDRPAELVRLWRAGPDAAVGQIERGGVADVAVTRWRDEGAAVLADVAGVKLVVVIARSIVERRRELAIRAALGAPTGRLVAMVARQGLVPVLAGAAAGLAAAWAGARLLQAFLFEIDPREPLVYGLALTVALVVAAAACLVPARRIAAIPPAMVLRGD